MYFLNGSHAHAIFGKSYLLGELFIFNYFCLLVMNLSFSTITLRLHSTSIRVHVRTDSCSLWVGATGFHDTKTEHQCNLMIFFLYPVAKQPALFCLKPRRPKRNITSLVWRAEEWYGERREVNPKSLAVNPFSSKWSRMFLILPQTLYCNQRCDNINRINHVLLHQTSVKPNVGQMCFPSGAPQPL